MPSISIFTFSAPSTNPCTRACTRVVSFFHFFLVFLFFCFIRAKSIRLRDACPRVDGARFAFRRCNKNPVNIVSRFLILGWRETGVKIDRCDSRRRFSNVRRPILTYPRANCTIIGASDVVFIAGQSIVGGGKKRKKKENHSSHRPPFSGSTFAASRRITWLQARKTSDKGSALACIGAPIKSN